MTLTIDSAARATPPSEDGRVLMHIGTGQICALNATGSRIWTALEAGSSLELVVETLVAEYGVSREQVDADVNAFVTLLARGRFVRVEGAAS